MMLFAEARPDIIGWVCFGGFVLIASMVVYFMWKATQDIVPSFGVSATPYKPAEPKLVVPVPEGKTVAGYLVDPNTKVLAVYVAQYAVIPVPGQNIVHGYARYVEVPDEKNTIKLVRAGTGFLVYGHASLPNGQWLPCR